MRIECTPQTGVVDSLMVARGAFAHFEPSEKSRMFSKLDHTVSVTSCCRVVKR